MRWLLGIVGLRVALVLILCIIGYRLPKSHVASASARFAAPPDAIWSSLTDVAAFPEGYLTELVEASYERASSGGRRTSPG